MNPLVSICLLSYNDESYLAQAIKDLLSQDYENIELIISDDASTDRSVDLIRKFAKRDGRIRAFYQKQNLGMQSNYNFLLRQVRGEFFCWASSDDRWNKKYISTLLDPMLRDNKIVSVGAPYIFIDESGSTREDIIPDFQLRDFESSSPVIRLIKFSIYYFDDFFYGLHRTSAVENMLVPVWWGLNRSVASNCPYPVQAYLLSAGRYKRVKSEPLFFKRVNLASPPRHSAKYRGKSLLSIMAFVLRKVNVLCETLVSIKKGSGSSVLMIFTSPFFIFRCLYDIGSYFFYLLQRLIDKLFARTRKNNE